MNDQPTPGQEAARKAFKTDEFPPKVEGKFLLSTRPKSKTNGQLLAELSSPIQRRSYTEEAIANWEEAAAKFTEHILAPINEALDAVGAPRFKDPLDHYPMPPAERIAALAASSKKDFDTERNLTREFGQRLNESEQALAKAKGELADARAAFTDYHNRIRICGDLPPETTPDEITNLKSLVWIGLEGVMPRRETVDAGTSTASIDPKAVEFFHTALDVASKLESQVCRNSSLPKSYSAMLQRFWKARDNWSPFRNPDATGLPSALRCPGDWPEDFTHENGNYQNKCCKCGEPFMGHKRRVVCRLCSNPMHSPLPTLEQDPASVGRQSEMVDNSNAPMWRTLVPGVDHWQIGDDIQCDDGSFEPVNPMGQLVGEVIRGKGRRPIRPSEEEKPDNPEANKLRVECGDLRDGIERAEDVISGLQADLVTARNRIAFLESPWRKMADGKPTEGDGNETEDVLWMTPSHGAMIMGWNCVPVNALAWMPIPRFTPSNTPEQSPKA